MSILTVSEQVTPTSPSAGKMAVYYKADGLFYTKNAAGIETLLNASALDAKIDLTQKGAANGVATLDAASKIPAAQLPSVAITDTFPVASQAAQVALTAQVGDVAVRTDQNLSYILMTEPASVFANWLVLLSPTDSVTSVAGKVGVVTLVKGDVGLGNVDNTSDATKQAATNALLAGGTLPIAATTLSATGALNFSGSGSIPSSGYGAYNRSGTGTVIVSSYKTVISSDGGITDHVTLDASGHLLVGVASGSWHQVVGSTAASGNPTLTIGGDGTATAIAFYPVSANGYSSANASASAMRIGSSTPTRSISASGTINASGADYAEYERNNGLTFAKGSIVGFKVDGTLTNVFADAIRYAVKSTDPSYVGGDTWGSEDQVGKRPDEPQRIADKTEQRELIPASAATEADPAVEATFETIILEAGDTDIQWATKQFDYATAKAAFEAALEAARQQVDRIAYSGKVPCNVLEAAPGDYIVASPTAEGGITGSIVTKADMTFGQYQDAVGRVNKILPDGRCEVAVIIH